MHGNFLFILKCPYYGLWKVHILVLGVLNNRLTCMQGQKILSFSYNMHLFLPYLLNNSQTIRSTIHFFQTPHLRDANLQWLVDLI